MRKTQIFFHHIVFIKDILNNSTGASEKRFNPIFNKRFDHLETLLMICRPKKVLSDGSLCGPLVSSPQSNAPKGPLCYPKSIMFPFQIYYQSHWNVSWKTKTNINFKGQTWVRPAAKCWVKGFILPQQYHAPNFYQRFWHTLANHSHSHSYPIYNGKVEGRLSPES